MREKIISLLLLAFLCTGIRAQRSLIPVEIVPKTDDALNRIFYASEKKDTPAVNNIVTELNNILQPYANEYPEFTGIMELHLGYYATDLLQRNQWIDKGIEHIKNADSTLAENFSGNFLWLIHSFAWDKRMDEWKTIDSVYRITINKGKDNRQNPYAVLNHGNNALNEKKYKLVSNLAQYELAYLDHFPGTTPLHKVNKIFAGWLELAQKFEQWKKLSYAEQTGNEYFMNEGQQVPDFLQKDNKEDSLLAAFDYSAAFSKLLEETKKLQKEFVTNNHRSDKDYDEFKRNNYYYLTNLLLSNYYTWAKYAQNESKPLLPLKLFLWQDVKDEMNDAKKNNKRPLIQAYTLVKAYSNLSNLYASVGNSDQSIDVLYEGIGQVISNSLFTTDEKLNAIDFYAQFVPAYRAAGNFEKANEANQKWLSFTSKPGTVITKENVVDLDRHYNAKIEAVFTLMAMGKYKEATDSTVAIIDSVAALVLKDESLIYETVSWVKLQYLTATISAQNGKWNRQLVKEMISDLMQERTHLNILYPGHLLMVKAEWMSNKKVSEEYLSNLLRHTAKQLYTNFTMLNAQERMQYFSNMLQEYFDVYHELLFEGALDNLPRLKEQVLNQSMFLKNSLADGNLIPDDLFSAFAKRNPVFLESLRKLRQDVILVNDKRKLYGDNNDAQLINDQLQLLWLDALSESSHLSANQASIVKKIDSSLNKEDVYIETIRYKQWLNDSSYVYGAYIIEKGKPLKSIKLCSEKNLLEILNNPAASPQNAAVAGNTRGTELLGKKNDHKKIYKAGDKDLLAALLLTPLSPYTAKKTWILVNDGLLNRIAFAALILNNKYLAEEISIRQLSSSSQLNTLNKMPRIKNAFIAGDIAYGAHNPANKNAVMQSSLQWQRLPGTKKEMFNLQKQLQESGYQTKVVANGSFEDSIYKNIGNYSIVHLATHGFYIPSSESSKYFNGRFSIDAVTREPLFRCGLAVSNANDPLLKDRQNTPGYIFGYELANTDLRNCYLVTLSACETGLGDLRNNMGVDGLSRALKIGGAKNLLISLWSVPDEATAVFMQHFYDFLLKTNNPAHSLRQTQLKMCKQYKATDWAGFILVE